LNGYIARLGDDLSFLKLVEKKLVKIMVMLNSRTLLIPLFLGRKTYDWV